MTSVCYFHYIINKLLHLINVTWPNLLHSVLYYTWAWGLWLILLNIKVVIEAIFGSGEVSFPPNLIKGFQDTFGKVWWFGIGIPTYFAHFQVMFACTKGFPNNDIMDNMGTSVTAGGVENCWFFGLRVGFSQNLIVILKTPLYKGMVIYWITIALWEGVVVLKGLR